MTAISFLARLPVADRMGVASLPWVLPERDHGSIFVYLCPRWLRPHHGHLYLDSEADVLRSIPISPPSPWGCFPVASPRRGRRACSPPMVSSILAVVSPSVSISPCPILSRHLPPSPLPGTGPRLVGRVRPPRFCPRRSPSSTALRCLRVVLRSRLRRTLENDNVSWSPASGSQMPSPRSRR